MPFAHTTAFIGLLEFSVCVKFKTEKNGYKPQQYITTVFTHFPANLILIASLSLLTESTAQEEQQCDSLFSVLPGLKSHGNCKGQIVIFLTRFCHQLHYLVLNQNSFLPESNICIPRVADFLQLFVRTVQKVFQKHTAGKRENHNSLLHPNIPLRVYVWCFPNYISNLIFHFAWTTFSFGSFFFHTDANATCAPSLPFPFKYLLNTLPQRTSTDSDQMV